MLVAWLHAEPLWPWSTPAIGLPALVLAAALLVGLTLWTYLGVPGATRRRVGILLGLRLAALAVACIVLLRPALASREELRQPSALILLLDGSDSMTIQDEFDQQSRWDALRRILRGCEPILHQLREEQGVAIHTYRFAEEVGEFDPQAPAQGKRTDFGQALDTLFKTHGADRNLRGLLVLSDGADNGTRLPALAQAARWRGLGCPIHTFALGQKETTSRQRDLILTSITAEPSPVPVKAKLTIKGTADAPGFEGRKVVVHLLLDDKPAASQEATLSKTFGNEFQLETSAPATPGEIKVTLKIEPIREEVVRANNELSTFVTVTKEGISVLYVEGKYRAYEPKFIRWALGRDPRIRLFESVRLTDAAPPPEEADLFLFDQQQYDVIILGDLTARRLSAQDPRHLRRIHDLVRDRGMGLLMMGGHESFGNSDWEGTPIADLLPVHLNVKGQADELVRLLPTGDGLRHYVLRLQDRDDDNKDLWSKLPRLNGMTRLGEHKPGAAVLARADNEKTGPPMLVGQTYGQGRTLAFAADTTWLWRNYDLPRSTRGVEAHARFWKQLVLWLAKQEEAAGNAWVEPDLRRVAAGERVPFTVGLRGKGGAEVRDAVFDVKVVTPANVEVPLRTARERERERGTVGKTDEPGEYRIVVRARGKDTDGQDIAGEASARFLAYQDDAEMLKQAADLEFLTRLANAGGGRPYRATDLSTFLQELRSLPQLQSRTRLKTFPSWKRSPRAAFPRELGDHVTALFASGTFPSFLFFAGLVCTEWYLRRRWGLV